jgi:Protein of unknown function (DUF1549)/Protein of unknown function (DUF1553)
MHRILSLISSCCIATISWAGPQQAPAGDVRLPTPLAPRSNTLTDEPWRGISTKPLTPAELDKLIANELKQDHLQPAPRICDDEFVRRVYLDLTGQLPLPADVREFAADKDSQKRAKLIDQLLASDEYAKHWMRYWRDVMTVKLSDRRVLAMTPSLQMWLEREFAANTPWDKLARQMLTAKGEVKVAEPSADAGAIFFLLAHNGDDQTEERASETARVFLGIQIGCAQCHDHPFDAWKQEQFHELAAYFSKVRYGVAGLNMPPNVTATLASNPGGRHRMPDKADPSKGTLMQPKFLDGSTPPPSVFVTDAERRQQLAEAIAGPQNFWFAAAFVNRTWGEFMGQSFSMPVDDLGPGRPVVMPAVLTRLSASFKGSEYDIKGLMRLICNSETYQRELRPGESADTHVHFAGSAPTRLKAETLWDSLVTVLGQMGRPGQRAQAMYNPIAAMRPNAGPEAAFVQEFRFDPSLKPDEVEGSIPQALILMNSPVIQDKVRATGTNLLARLLEAYPQDSDAVRAVYMRTLARKPSDKEADKSLAYIKKVGKRSEAYEDLLWALLNSAEFLSRR